jgi:hypothetical protein
MKQIKYLKPGVRVTKKNDVDSPVMEVVKYVEDYVVECVYFIDNERNIDTIDERNLVKTGDSGLYKL